MSARDAGPLGRSCPLRSLRRLITELIDDSEGNRVFSQAHLQALLADLRARPGLPSSAAAALAAVERRLAP